MKDTYKSFLEKLEKFKKDSTSTKEQKDAMIGLFKVSISILENSINYQKSKAKSVINSIELIQDDLLVSFFGNDDIIENEVKLNNLKEKLNEIITEPPL
jgi:esterase/lipase